MKVIELIEELKKYPPDLKVCIIDYDHGYFEIKETYTSNEIVQISEVEKDSSPPEQVVILD
jgi:hypothetical protein